MELHNKILVVDDDQDIGSMLKMMLEYKGYKVTLINRADHTEDALGKNNINLIILDKLIAGINGTDVCKKLKANPRYAHIPILMISALPNARQFCLDSGANDFIYKPFEMDAILDKIHQLLLHEKK